MRLPELARNRRFDVVAVGENSLDIVAVRESGTTVAGKATLASLGQQAGGQMATAALACARLGLRTRYIGAFGADAWAPLVRAPLEAAGVDVVSLPVAPGTPSRTAVIVVGEDGDRQIYEHCPPALAAGADALERDTIAACRILLVDATQPAVALRAVEYARSADVLTICDVDRPGPETDALLAAIDVAVVPVGLAMHLTGEHEPARAAAALGDVCGRAQLIVVTCGADGSVCRCGDDLVTTPAFAVDVVDTTGAGDAFRAGLAAGLVHLDRGAAIADLLDLANAAAALNCRAAGAQRGLPTYGEVRNLVDRAGRRQA